MGKRRDGPDCGAILAAVGVGALFGAGVAGAVGAVIGGVVGFAVGYGGNSGVSAINNR